MYDERTWEWKKSCCSTGWPNEWLDVDEQYRIDDRLNLWMVVRLTACLLFKLVAWLHLVSVLAFTTAAFKTFLHIFLFFFFCFYCFIYFISFRFIIYFLWFSLLLLNSLCKPNGIESFVYVFNFIRFSVHSYSGMNSFQWWL